MKKICIIIIAVTFIACDKTPPEIIDEDDGILKVLAIGNSFLLGSTEGYLMPIANENNKSLIVGNVIHGDGGLKDHWEFSQNDTGIYFFRLILQDTIIQYDSVSLLHCIKSSNWDYIFFQQVSSLSGIYESYFPYTIDLKNYVLQNTLKKDVEICFHQTWAYGQKSNHYGFANYNNDQQTMYDSIINASRAVCEKMNIKIIVPSATAMQNARHQFGDIFCYDGIHVNALGNYLVACTWYEILFEIDCLDTKVVPQHSISEEDLLIIRLAAHNACISPFTITKN